MDSALARGGIFLNSAFAADRNGGLLRVTCTAMAFLAATHVGMCLTMCAAIPWHSRWGHEFGLRLALSNLAMNAARYNKHITPLVCFHADFSVRPCAGPLVDKLATLSTLDDALVLTGRSRGSFFINQLMPKKNAVKTNAPAAAFWDILRAICTAPPRRGASRTLGAVADRRSRRRPGGDHEEAREADVAPR